MLTAFVAQSDRAVGYNAAGLAVVAEHGIIPVLDLAPFLSPPSGSVR